MGRLFNYDSPLFTMINKFVDSIFLSLLWLLFSIPLITIGASSSALYYTANKVLRHSRGYVFREFWGSFKSCFKQSTILWVIFAVIAIVLRIDSYLLEFMIPEGLLLTIAKAFFYAMLFILIMLAVYAFPYIGRFELDLKSIVKNSAFIALRHLGWTVLLIVIAAVGVLLFLVALPIAVFIVPAVCALLAGLIIEKIFKRYMSKEDVEKEAKLNADYK